MADYNPNNPFPSQDWIDFCNLHGVDDAGIVDEIPPKDIAAMQRGMNLTRLKVSNHEIQTEDRYERVDVINFAIQRSWNASEVPLRLYQPVGWKGCGTYLPIYIHFHGGGFLSGNLDTEDATCFRMVDALANDGCPIVLLSVNYCHTTEAPYPAAFHDAWDVLRWVEEWAEYLHGDRNRIILGGMDSGAALALSMAHTVERLRVAKMGMNHQSGTLAGVVLGTPWFPHMDADGHDEESRVENCAAPMLSGQFHRLFRELLGVGGMDSPYAVGEMSNFSALPRTTVLIAGMSLLRDQAVKMTRCFKRDGIEHQVVLFPGLPHDFRRFGDLAACQDWDDQMIKAIKWSLDFAVEHAIWLQLDEPEGFAPALDAESPELGAESGNGSDEDYAPSEDIASEDHISWSDQ
ncbi:alpha/beta-hydrolase [Aspergillus heteromorphus CBS 117.55]|uniref:Alpha/beta-hydrolase n=1 Tax=Aspergillus heteromorphus CBS 117.55 TaxID=1448321 RepID=A0A317VL25_9EURO|nr:alpha/beta-hydrolase [Aspergillus heteromorphus CBS 117.55]PWY75016.1 alpha/beta-hydrolase [Aspergillus heteromorphus CBS 117.55]